MRGPRPHSPSAGPEVPATWLGASGALPGPAEKPGRGAQLAAGGGHVGNGTNGRRPQEPAVSAAGAAVASCPATPAGRGGCAPPPHPLLPAAPHCSSLLLQPGMQSKGRKEQRSHRGWKSECQADTCPREPGGRGGETASLQEPCRGGRVPAPPRCVFTRGRLWVSFVSITDFERHKRRPWKCLQVSGDGTACDRPRGRGEAGGPSAGDF